MLLFKLDMRESGCQRKRYITIAQLTLAKTGHACFSMSARVPGVMREERGCMFGCTDSLARANSTRAKM